MLMCLLKQKVPTSPEPAHLNSETTIKTTPWNKYCTDHPFVSPLESNPHL